MRPRWMLLFLLYCLTISLQVQVYKQQAADKWPEADTSKMYTLKGFRHGVSFFPKVKYPEVEYTPSSTLSFDKYHTADVVYHWMKKWAEQYPNLIEL